MSKSSQQHTGTHSVGGTTGTSVTDISLAAELLNPDIMQFVLGYKSTDGDNVSVPIIKPALISTFAAFVALYMVLAIVAVAGNIAMLAYIARYRLYRDVTHAFLSNLALAHIVQVCMAMPMTVMIIIIQNWIYGKFMCFFTPLLQVSR